MLRIHAFVLLGVLGLAAVKRPQQDIPLKTGDVVFQTSRSAQSRAIQEATGSPWSHVGIIEVTSKGTWVIEAAGPVKRTPWRTWRRRGVDGQALVTRPKGVGESTLERVVFAASAELGKPYDPRFGWGDDAYYCSELVAKAFERGAGIPLGRRERLGDLRIGGSRREIEARWGGQVPGDLVLVTPAALAEDPRLERVGIIAANEK
jgi:Permuted papain-like amidase enzyme, YaeF/YiiX, C92 family